MGRYYSEVDGWKNTPFGNRNPRVMLFTSRGRSVGLSGVVSVLGSKMERIGAPPLGLVQTCRFQSRWCQIAAPAGGRELGVGVGLSAADHGPGQRRHDAERCGARANACSVATHR